MVTRLARLLYETHLPYRTKRQHHPLPERPEMAAGDRVQHVVFFSFSARGEAEPYSSLDLIVVANMALNEMDTLSGDLETADGVPLMLQLWSPHKHKRQLFLKILIYVKYWRYIARYGHFLKEQRLVPSQDD